MNIVSFSKIKNSVKDLKDFQGEPMYDSEYYKDSFFVLYESNMEFENFCLQEKIKNKIIAGYIFTGNLTVKKQIHS